MVKTMQDVMRRSIFAAGLLVVSNVAALAQQDISEDTVKSFMNYAWSMTPAKFTKPNGTLVEIDKKVREKVEVPVDVAREVIRAGRMTAHAQLCELPEDQVLNYRSLMKREELKKKWSEQQMIYINQLHLTTVMLLTGKVKLVEQDDGAKQPVIEEKAAATVKSCTDEQAKKVKALIAVYLKSGPPVSLDTAAAPSTAAPAASPAPAVAPASPTPAVAPAAPAAKKP